MPPVKSERYRTMNGTVASSVPRRLEGDCERGAGV
jgi:hypothetical protein